MFHKKSANRITIINILSTVILQGISFLTAPIFSRILGTENYGTYAVFTTWVSVIGIVFSLQTSSTIPIAMGAFPENEQEKYQSSTLFLSILSFLAFSAVAVLLLEPFSRLMGLDKMLCILLLIQGFGQMCVLYANGKFTNEFQAENNFKLSIGSALGGVALSFLFLSFIPAEYNHYGRILGVTVTYLLLAVVVCVIILGRGKVFYNRTYWKFCLPIAIPCIFHAISGTILNQSDRIMLQRMVGDAQVGVYSLSYSFGAIITTIYLSLNNSWIPFFFDYFRQGQIEGVRQRARNYTELFTVLSLGFVLLTPEVFHIFAGKMFWEGERFIPLFVISNYFTFLYSFPVNYEAYHKNTKVMAITTSIAAAVNIVLNYFFILRFGTLGAVIATLISHVLQFLVHYICAKYLIKTGEYPFSLYSFLPYLLSVVVVSAICLVIGSRFALARWLIGAALGAWELLRILKRKSIF